MMLVEFLLVFLICSETRTAQDSCERGEVIVRSCVDGIAWVQAGVRAANMGQTVTIQSCDERAR